MGPRGLKHKFHEFRFIKYKCYLFPVLLFVRRRRERRGRVLLCCPLLENSNTSFMSPVLSSKRRYMDYILNNTSKQTFIWGESRTVFNNFLWSAIHVISYFPASLPLVCFHFLYFGRRGAKKWELLTWTAVHRYLKSGTIRLASDVQDLRTNMVI